MKMLRKTLAVILCLSLILGTLGTGGFGVLASATESGACGENVTWTLSDEGVLTISGTGKITDYSYDRSARVIVIENGVTGIGDGAFSNFDQVESVSLPDTLKSIGESAFALCSIKSITLPGGLTSVGIGLFADCSKLESVVISVGITEIAPWTFNKCTNLKSVRIPASVTNIYSNSFADHGENLVIRGCPGTYAQEFAQANNIGFNVSHLFGTTYQYDKTSHRSVCTDCQALSESESHSDVNHDGFCDVCLMSGLNTPHTFGGEWQHDATGHWQFCTDCTATSDPESHDDDDHDGTCDICGETGLPIKHTYGEEWKSDADGHWHECTVCGSSVRKDYDEHKPAAAIKENEVAATYSADGTFDEVVYCSDCNRELSRTAKTTPKKDIMPAGYTTKAAYKTNVTVRLRINNVPDGAKVYVAGNEATLVNGKYEVDLGQFGRTMELPVQIKLGNEVLDTATLTVNIDDSLFAVIGSWFSNFLFNGFRWRKIFLDV